MRRHIPRVLRELKAVHRAFLGVGAGRSAWPSCKRYSSTSSSTPVSDVKPNVASSSSAASSNSTASSSSIPALESSPLPSSTTPTSIFEPVTLPGSEDNKPFYITTPTFSVNASPHIGHLHSMVLADTLARYSKFRYPERKVFLTTGTNEHGRKVERAAKTARMDVRRFCNMMSEKFRALADMARVDYTDFIRTTEHRHKTAVLHFWGRLMKSADTYEPPSDLYRTTHSGWYSIADERYFSESQVEKRGRGGRHVSRETENEVIREEEAIYMFKSTDYKEKLQEWIERGLIVSPPSSRFQFMSMLDRVEDVPVSRPKSMTTLGINVPNDPTDGQIIHVWFDALVNYLTSLGYPDSTMGWPADIHVVGKDIVKYHTIHWPAMLFSAGLEPPRSILSHGHWTVAHQRMAKWRQNVVEPVGLLQHWGPDAIRWYLMRSGGTLPSDADYSVDQLGVDYKFLSLELGNLISRNTSFDLLNRASGFKETDRNDEMERHLAQVRRDFGDKMERLEISRACEVIVYLIRQADKLFTDLKPWLEQSNPSSAIYYAYQSLRLSGLLLRPIMPSKSEELLDRIEVPLDARTWKHAAYAPGQEADFARIKDGLIEARSRKERFEQGGLFESFRRKKNVDPRYRPKRRDERPSPMSMRFRRL